MGGLAPGAHQHHHALGLRCSVVIKQVIRSARVNRQRIHGLLHDPGTTVDEGVDGLPRLERDVRVLGRAPDDRVVWRESPFPMFPDALFVDHAPQSGFGEHRDLRGLVRDPESVEEMENRNTGFQSDHL